MAPETGAGSEGGSIDLTGLGLNEPTDATGSFRGEDGASPPFRAATPSATGCEALADDAAPGLRLSRSAERDGSEGVSTAEALDGEPDSTAVEASSGAKPAIVSWRSLGALASVDGSAPAGSALGGGAAGATAGGSTDSSSPQASSMASVGGVDGETVAVGVGDDALTAAAAGPDGVVAAGGLDGAVAAAGCGSGSALESAPQSSSMASVGGGTEASDVAGGCDGEAGKPLVDAAFLSDPWLEAPSRFPMVGGPLAALEIASWIFCWCSPGRAPPSRITAL